MRNNIENETSKESHHGKQANQKVKPLLVLMYLLRNTDENHFVTGKEIAEYLKDNGIYAERRSIYTDIEQINKVVYMVENYCSLEEAEDALEEAEDFEKPVIYDEHHKGYRLKHQNYEFDTVRMLIECVYTAKFIDKVQSKGLIELICGMVSEHQGEKLRHDVLNIDYEKTDNTDVFMNVSIIHEAMSTRIDGEKHEPEKITFYYLKYSINDLKRCVYRGRDGDTRIVSPYQLIISDGYYYLSCFDDDAQAMRKYRVDRMTNIQRTGIPREGKKVAEKEDYKSYTQRVFSMFGGEKTYIELKLINSLLDSVVDKFGNDKSKYHKVDDHHFLLRTSVEISRPFFAWLCGFGTGVEILNPPEVRTQYLDYLSQIAKKYEKQYKDVK